MAVAQPPQLTELFSLMVTCEAPLPLGKIRGGDAMMIAITGGEISGPRLQGEVLPGGTDWAVRLSDGHFVVDARYAIKAADGTIIQVFNGASQMLDPASLRMITQPRFIAPEGPHEWLNHSVYVATLEPDLNTGNVSIVVYEAH
ncbi:DUF3237 family protein [Halioxenophilus sp. WMMB6]|uniref:DUF3237 family protein n=1 Tax=Halioxenophilus sp. WMMB6 TaxID=3073815 RepID=UPI00295E6E44|nr:DUF3237 family protein [Halioxenophilus sp. WMMB6]